jgi:hypothetical protein
MNNTFLLLIFLSQQLLQAQTRPKIDSVIGTYPLGIGNTWQYCTYDYLNGQYTWIYGWTEKVIGDTVMSNLKRYSVIKSDKRIVKNIFVSQELNKVYQYINSRDSLLYDYEKRAGDTLLFIPVSNNDTLLQIISDERFNNYFGQSRHVWTYYMHLAQMSYYEQKDIVDGIGMGYLIREGGDEWFLRGAIINGVTYGTILSVKNENDSRSKLNDYELFPNYPNPFNLCTTISFSIENEQHIRLTIYDLLGREVIQLLDDIMPSGLHTIVWNGKNESGKEEASGLYLFRLQTKMGIRQSKMLMVK